MIFVALMVKDDDDPIRILPKRPAVGANVDLELGLPPPTCQAVPVTKSLGGFPPALWVASPRPQKPHVNNDTAITASKENGFTASLMAVSSAGLWNDA